LYFVVEQARTQHQVSDGADLDALKAAFLVVAQGGAHDPALVATGRQPP
jgi:hypothetical protein